MSDTAEHPAIKAIAGARCHPDADSLWINLVGEVRALIAERDAAIGAREMSGRAALSPVHREALRTVCDAYAYAYCTPDADRAVALVRRHFGLTVERTEP